MATKRTTGTSSSSSNSATETEPMPAQNPGSGMPEWMAQATEEGLKPEQALAFIGLGLMQKMATSGQERPWMWSESEDGGQADLSALRQRLEQARKELSAASSLRQAVPSPMALEMETLAPWHQLVLTVWNLSASLRASGVPLPAHPSSDGPEADRP